MDLVRDEHTQDRLVRHLGQVREVTRLAFAPGAGIIRVDAVGARRHDPGDVAAELNTDALQQRLAATPSTAS